ncbi:MAG: alanine racemase [Nitrospirales bacterium]|nr:alanine racemase [Nitrospirales bacterium]
MTSPTLSLGSHLSPITVSVDLTAVCHNYQAIRLRLLPGTKILAIVKADAYGHGAIPIAQTLQGLGVFGFGVASVHEGALLREGGIQNPILVMGPLQSAHMKDLFQYRLTPVISHRTIFSELLSILPKNVAPYPIHLKVDTGLHRLGMDPEHILEIFQCTQPPQSPVTISGLMTHFADADNPDSTFTTFQLTRFRSLIEHIQSSGFALPDLHVANSAGILFYKEAHFEMVRPGLMLYGYAPGHPEQDSPIRLQPALAATTYIAHLRSLQPGDIVGYNALFRATRPSKIAILPVGYTHGFPRKLTGIGHVLIQGKTAPIIGKICMDMMMVDVTEIPGTTIGQEVRLLGTQGSRSISAEDYANWLETIPYEVLCGIGGKAKKLYQSTEVG